MTFKALSLKDRANLSDEKFKLVYQESMKKSVKRKRPQCLNQVVFYFGIINKYLNKLL